MFPKTSLGSLGLIVGSILTVIGVAAYALDNATLNLVGFFYGIPLVLGGLALKAAELKPVPVEPPTPAAVLALRDQQATKTQTQIRKDVTRYRYGQEAHLDTALKYLGLSPTDEERPVLLYIREVEVDGRYGLVLGFESPLIEFARWEGHREKMERFFGPNVRVELSKLDDTNVELHLISEPALQTAAVP